MKLGAWSAALALVVAAWSCSPDGVFDSDLPAVPFDRERWIADPGSHRLMVDDLIANHLKIGMPKSEVVELLGLGPWDRDVGRFDSDARGDFYREDVGPVRSLQMKIACCQFQLGFDEHGLLSVVSVDAY